MSTNLAKPVSRDLMSHPDVRDTLAMVRATSDGVPDLEVALMELAIADLDRKRGRIESSARAKVNKSMVVRKFYRAVARTRFTTGVDVPERVWKAAPETASDASGKQWVDTSDVDRYHITGYWRDLRPGEKQTSETKAKIEELEAKGEAGAQDQLVGSNESIGQMPSVTPQRPTTNEALEGIFDVVENEQVQGAMKSFLSENSLGQGVVAVAEFFSRTGGKFQFAAKAISEFGPFTGARIAHNYFRYGGYDVPLKQQGDKVVTEMGDTLPPPGDQERTRNSVIGFLKSRLPGRGADNSGSEPPSEGFVIDRNGNVIAHGVGRGNDHFLPFNTRHLRKIRQNEGSEYVRRRMFGGPTAEDLHAAMMMGASKVTVVSNGGVFSIDLTNRSHGIKLEHMQVLSRFQEILDNRGNNLNFNAYNSALEALESEFPLHFRKDDELTEAGDWSDANDRIRPKDRLIDQLKGMFDALGGRDTDDDVVVPSRPSGTGNKISIGGQRTGEDAFQAFRRQVQANPRARQALLKQMEQAMRERGGNPDSSSFILKQREIIARERRGEQVKTPSTAGDDWRSVEIRDAATPDETTRKAQVVQPPADSGLESIKNRQARDRIREVYGDYFDTNRIRPGEAETFNRLTGIAAHPPSWERFLDDEEEINRFGRAFMEHGE